jgi:acyl-ACP thioesterase
MEKDLSIWEDNYKIHSYEVDFNGNATLPVICHFLQESAWNHARYFDFGYDFLMNNSQIWVLSRLGIEIDSYPKWDDTITIQTWAKGIDRLFALRDYRLLSDSGKEIGRISSAWLIIDLIKRRPQRIEPYLDKMPLLPDRHAMPEMPGKIQSVENGVASGKFPVRISDLDVYHHVNNTRYIQWLTDNYEYDFVKNKFIHRFDINFMQEAQINDEINIITESIEDGRQFRHSLGNVNTGKEFSRAEVLWQEY